MTASGATFPAVYDVFSGGCADWVAVVEPGGRSFSYRQLLVTGARVARYLVDAGGKLPSLRLQCRHRGHVLAALSGAWQAGLSIELAGQPFVAAALGERAQEGASHAATEPLPDTASASAPCLVLHDGELARGLDVAPWVRQGAGDRSRPGLVLPAEQDLVTLCTSASSAEARRWPKNARQLFAEARVLVEHLQLGRDDRVLCTAPVDHLYGLLLGSLVPLVAGCSVVSEAPLHAEPLSQVLANTRPSVLVTVPAVLHALMAAGVSIQGLRLIVSSGARLSEELAAAWEAKTGAPVIDVLGSTETGGIATRRAAIEGGYRPLPAVSARPTPAGQLQVRSPFLADPAAWFTTADRIEALAEGCFVHLGREDDVVKVGGKRVHLHSVEQCALKLPGVSDARALVVDVPGSRQKEIWLVVESEVWSAQRVRHALSRELDPLSLPRRVRTVSSLPRGDRGKVARGALRALFEPPPAAPSTDEPANLRVPTGALGRHELDLGNRS